MEIFVRMLRGLWALVPKRPVPCPEGMTSVGLEGLGGAASRMLRNLTFLLFGTGVLCVSAGFSLLPMLLPVDPRVMVVTAGLFGTLSMLLAGVCILVHERIDEHPAPPIVYRLALAYRGLSGIPPVWVLDPGMYAHCLGRLLRRHTTSEGLEVVLALAPEWESSFPDLVRASRLL